MPLTKDAFVTREAAKGIAQAMFEDGNRVAVIHARLAEAGVRVSEMTVRRWASPYMAERERARDRARAPRR